MAARSDTFALGGTTDCDVTMENTGYDDALVSMRDLMPSNLSLVSGSVVGGDEMARGVGFDGTLLGAGAPSVDVTEDPSPFGYVSMASLSIPPFDFPSDLDEGGWIVDGFDFYYLGEHYTEVIWSTNGTVEAGSDSMSSAGYQNFEMPNTAIPNNLLAPWWTDIDFNEGGLWYLASITADNITYYTVFEWENAPSWGDPASTANFQIWIEDGTDNIWFLYGGFTGTNTIGTVGAEDATGTVGDTYYFNGSGPMPSADVGVIAIPGLPGEVHTVSFTAEGVVPGPWTNCAGLKSDTFFGTNVACFDGTVQGGP